MGWIIWILIGALIGWLASLVMKTNAQQGALANIVIGIVGSMLGNFVFGDILRIGSAESAGNFGVMGILWGVVGACLLIFLLQALGIFFKKKS